MDYRAMCEELKILTGGVPHPAANLANAAALIYDRLPDINWAGFYMMEDGILVLGPFQGKTARVEIPVGSGVCGTAAERRETVVVPDVHEFPGHIACDITSNAEIVVPLLDGDELLGVLDIDSRTPGRFTDEDRAGLEAFAEILVPGLK